MQGMKWWNWLAEWWKKMKLASEPVSREAHNLQSGVQLSGEQPSLDDEFSSFYEMESPVVIDPLAEHRAKAEQLLRRLRNG